MSRKLSGDSGEKEICEKVPCPNCGKALMCLPPNYPIYDVQCTGCTFRAQVKTNLTKPKKEVFGATWEIVSKTLKAGYQVAPLIANFKWTDGQTNKQEIRFYPFIPKANLKPYTATFSTSRSDLRMFNYIGLDTLPHFVLFSQ